MVKKTVKAVCQGGCGGTGLYPGMAEGPGGAVVCGQCGGTGCQFIEYVPFKKRIRRRKANGRRLTVVFLPGPWSINIAERKTVTPKEFYSGKIKKAES